MHDFVELFNRSDETQTLGGWRLDYADVHGEDWRTLDLSPLTLSPHRYALVGLKSGAPVRRSRQLTWQATSISAAAPASCNSSMEKTR